MVRDTIPQGWGILNGMMSAFVLSQIAVAGAVVCNLLSFQFKRRETVVSLLSASTFFVALQFYFLDLSAALFLTLYALGYFLVSIFTTDRRLMWLFMVGGFVIFFYTYESWLDYFPLFSTVITLWSIYNDNQKQMRQLQMVGATSRTIFYTIIFSPVGILLELTLLSSNISAYWRFYLRTAKPKLKE